MKTAAVVATGLLYASLSLAVPQFGALPGLLGGLQLGSNSAPKPASAPAPGPPAGFPSIPKPDKGSPPPAPGKVIACGAQLKLLGQAASSFCTSFVGGVQTQTTTLTSTAPTSTLTSTDTTTLTLPAPVATSTETDTSTITIFTPTTIQTSTEVTSTSTSTSTTYTIGTAGLSSSCNIPSAAPTSQKRAVRRQFGNNNNVWNAIFQQASSDIASACSKYVIVTPTATASTTYTPLASTTVTSTATETPATTTTTVTTIEEVTTTLASPTIFSTSTSTAYETASTTVTAADPSQTDCVSGLTCKSNVCVAPTCVTYTATCPPSYYLPAGNNPDLQGTRIFLSSSLSNNQLSCIYRSTYSNKYSGVQPITCNYDLASDQLVSCSSIEQESGFGQCFCPGAANNAYGPFPAAPAATCVAYA